MYQELPALDVQSGLFGGRVIEVGAAKVSRSILKQSFDFSVALLALVFLSPALVLIAAAIAVDSRGPVLFTQMRTGRGRRPFRIFKFRTMRQEQGAEIFVQAVADDPRTTRVGRFLRRTSLDEIPQLLNVLRGEMALVGPRPHPLPLDAALAEMFANYWDRSLVRPGLTGLAQIRGFRGPTDTLAKARARLALDRAYIRRWSFWNDLKILAATPFFLFDPGAV